MAPLPKRKRSQSRQGMRMNNQGIALKSISNCPQCGKATLPHRVCRGCGTYAGRQVLKVQPAQE